MKFQRFPSVVIALCLGLILPAGGLIAQGDSQAVSQFLANPTQALQQYPNGGARLISLMRDVAVAHPEALSTIMSDLSSANTDQQAAIGSGLGQAAQISVRTDQAYANQIQQALASSNSDAAKTAFAGVTGDTTIGAAGGGGGGGVGGPVNSGLPTGGGGSGGGSTGGGFSNGHSGLTGGSGGPGGSGGNGSTQLLTGGGTGGLSSSLTTDQGEFSASGGIATINVSGGTVTVNVLTGQLTFTNKSNQSSTVSAGDTAQFEGGAVTQLMATTDALKSNNSAFAQVTQQSLLSTISSVAALSKSLPGNTQVSDLLQTLVTQSAKLAADSGDSTLLANVVAFAVANASADQKSAIIQAANNGVNSSSSTDKTNLNTLVADSADKGSTLGSTAAAPTTQQSVNGSGQTITTIITPLDPSQVLIISPST